MSERPLISGMVVHWGEPAPLLELVAAWPEDSRFELVVVDNGPRFGEPEAAWERVRERARVVSAGRNLGFGGGANAAARVAQGGGAAGAQSGRAAGGRGAGGAGGGVRGASGGGGAGASPAGRGRRAAVRLAAAHAAVAGTAPAAGVAGASGAGGDGGAGGGRGRGAAGGGGAGAAARGVGGRRRLRSRVLPGLVRGRRPGGAAARRAQDPPLLAGRPLPPRPRRHRRAARLRALPVDLPAQPGALPRQAPRRRSGRPGAAAPPPRADPAPAAAAAAHAAAGAGARRRGARAGRGARRRPQRLAATSWLGRPPGPWAGARSAPRRRPGRGRRRAAGWRNPGR